MMISDNEEKTEHGRKRERISRILAIMISALLFGVIHMNLVQFIYAGVLGILLAWFMEKAGHFYGAFLAHMGANLMAVLRVEMPAFSWMKPEDPQFVTVTVVLAAASILLIAVIQLFSMDRRAKA